MLVSLSGVTDTSFNGVTLEELTILGRLNEGSRLFDERSEWMEKMDF